MEYLSILLNYLGVILAFIIIINFRWCVKTLRDIASNNNDGGYTRLIQTILLFFLIIVLCGVVFYYIHNPEKVDRIDVIFTVVVGWFSLVIGRFFGEKAMEGLADARKNNAQLLQEKLQRSILQKKWYRDNLHSAQNKISKLEKKN